MQAQIKHLIYSAFRWYVFRAWGRVGTTIGGNKLETFGSVKSCKAQFHALYQEKTGNCWADRKNFQKYPNKFFPIEMDYGQVGCL